MKTLIERASYLLGLVGNSPTELAKIAGVKPPSVSDWLNGKTKSLSIEPATKLARRFGLNPLWVSKGISPMKDLSPSSNTKPSESSAESTGNVIAIHPDDELPDGMISIMEHQVSFSAGNGHMPNYELIEEREPATYRLSWFQRERINPNNVKRFKVTGDSMEPFLYSGDSVLVNLAENDPSRIVDGKVYAIRYGDELRVKRLHRRLDGTLTLRSENPAYKDEDVPPELAEEHITIIGRVRDKSGAGGL